MTERDLTVFAELLQRLNETLKEPAIAVESKVHDALGEIIGKNVVKDAAPRVFRISGQEIVDWYGGEKAVKEFVKNLGLYKDAAKNEWLANEVLKALKTAVERKFDAAIEKYYAGKVYKNFHRVQGSKRSSREY